MPVDEDDAGEVVGRSHELDEDLLERVQADRERAGEASVLAAGPVRERGGHQHVATPTGQLGGQGHGDGGVGVQGQVRPVLLAAPEGDGEQRAHRGDVGPRLAAERRHRSR